jgi:hypothetical protein
MRFLATFKADIATINPMNFSTLKSSKNEELRVECGVVRHDMPEMLRPEFDRLIDAIYRVAGTEQQAMDAEKYRKIWLSRIEELILFIEGI